jgi:hypothetical protein
MAELNPQKALIAYLEGEVKEAEARKIEAQLACDDDLRQELEKLRGARLALRAAFEVSPNHRFADKVVGRIVAEKQTRLWWRLMPAMAFGGLAVLITLFIIPREPEKTGILIPRGPSAENDKPKHAVGIETYLHRKSDPLKRTRVRDGMQVSKDDGFSFVLHNRSSKPTYLMVFGMDAKGQIHWFYPAVENDARDLSSVRVSAAPAMQALPDGVTPGVLPGGSFRIIALFTERPKKNGEVADALREEDISGLNTRFPDAVLQITTLSADGE